jgi:hypothetical protein
MQTRFVFVLFTVILLLAACGGSPEPAVQEGAADTTDDAAEVAGEGSDELAPASSDERVNEDTDESDAGAGASVDESSDESATQEAGASTTDTSDAEAAGDMIASRPASGTDPETGIEINPDTFGPGDEFIVRGTIISMNLTPTVSPEFLIEAPSGRKYRIRSQDLAETYFDDGAQLRPHEYRQGILAEATVSLPSDAGPADILLTDDLTLLREE